MKAWRSENPQRCREHERKSKSLNADKVRARTAVRMRAWRRANPAKLKEQNDKRLQDKLRWAKENKPKRSALNRVRGERRRTALGDREFEQLFFVEAYDLALKRRAATGVAWEVDHVVPLNGKTVCGLHVSWNIAVVPMVVNRSKGNRHEGV